MRAVMPVLTVAFERNLLLRALPLPERARLAKQADVVVLTRGDVLFEPGDDVTHVHFPLDGAILTLLLPLREGRTIETVTVRREGAIGGVVSQGYLTAFNRAIVQMGGPALRIGAGYVQAAKQASSPVRNALTRYSDCLLAQVLQSVACNAVHSIEQRCAKWLLTLHDRLGVDVLPVTQDVLADMLGVCRTHLSDVLRRLHNHGLVDVGRARITVRDRAALGQAACECHARASSHLAQVLGAAYAPDGTLVAFAPDQAPSPLVSLPEPISA